ncbi:MAG: c-type cytochrome, partial [Cyclobacteriaceae bacterium]|nr:c-type cytochrome [Cyclobacteriaceae bacterium]
FSKGLVKTRETFEELAEQAVNKSLAEEIILDLMEAIEASGEKALMAKMDLFRADQSALGEYTGTLAGGSQQLGQRYFFNNTTGQCIRCHSLEGEGGEVGPSLDHIGDILSREELLQALVQPSARLSPGFGSVTVTMKDGKKITGVLLEEKEESLVLRTSESKQLEIAIAETTDRVNLPSGMPPMGSLMSKRELRDVIEFLSSLKK